VDGHGGDCLAQVEASHAFAELISYLLALSPQRESFFAVAFRPAAGNNYRYLVLTPPIRRNHTTGARDRARRCP
jgi:hypothetical protein